VIQGTNGARKGRIGDPRKKSGKSGRFRFTFEDEEEIDIKAVQAEIVELETQLAEVRSEMDKYLSELCLV